MTTEFPRGPQVHGAMRAIKEALDRPGILNPGVMFSSAEWWERWGASRPSNCCEKPAPNV